MEDSMITDKDISEARIIIDMVGGNSIQWREVRDIISRIRAESAEQARKEAADRLCDSCHGKEDGMCGECPDRAVILNSPVKEGKTDAEKLAIAVKALEEASISLAKTDGDYDTLCVIRSALRNVGNIDQLPTECNNFDLPDFARTDVDK
jgi:hypothetical protein